MKKYNYTLLLFLSLAFSWSVKGQESEELDHFKIIVISENRPVFGATVNWLNTTIGAVSDEKGKATLKRIDLPAKILVSHVGYRADTIEVLPTSPQHIYYEFLNENTLEQVEIRKKRQASFISSVESIKTEILSSDELNKAACCDLSESFVNNATVDVGEADAVSGAKEITFLGLDGVYVQKLINNIPSVRGLASAFGMNYIPGPWIKQIAVSKGGGSVVNGYESMTGSIGLVFKDIKDEKLNVDLFGNHLGRVEANVLGQIKVGKEWSTALGGNFGIMKNKFDRNGDSFLDRTLYTRYNLLNKWDRNGEKTMQHIALQGIYENRESGQLGFYSNDADGNDYGIGIETKHLNAYFKNGFRFDGNPYQSLAIVLNGFVHEEESFFGNNRYNGNQYSINGNVIFQTIVKTTDHKISTGASILVDRFDEELNDNRYKKDEYVPGIFLEYTYSLDDKFSLVSGLRYDQHNLFGAQLSPRVHLKYAPKDRTTFRLSASRGFRSANLFAENKYLLATSRDLIWDGVPLQDALWNYGINFTQSFPIKNRDGYFTVDFYRTDFTNLTVVDLDQSVDEIVVRNTRDQAFSNSLQIELGGEVVKGLTMKVAYKLDDARAVFDGRLTQNPLTVRNKGLYSISYNTPNEEWQFDWITKIHGAHRLVFNELTPERGRFSPRYVIMNFQVNKYFEKGIEIYVGGENLTNFTQANPILGFEEPFENGFDASQVWGPIVGGIFYGGLRYKLK